MSERGATQGTTTKRRGTFVPGRTASKKRAKKDGVSSERYAATGSAVTAPPELLEIRGTGTFYGASRGGKPHGDGMLWEARTRRLWIGSWVDGTRRGWFDAYEAPRDVAFDLRERLKRVNRVEDLVSLGRAFFDADGAPSFRHESRRDAASAFSAPPRWRAHRYLGACRPPTDAALREVASLGGGAPPRPWWRRFAPFFECAIDPAPAASASPLLRDDTLLPPTTLRFSFRSNATGTLPVEAMMKQGRSCYVGTFDDTGERYLDGTLLFLENSSEPDTLAFDRARDAARRTPGFLPPGRAWRVRRYSAGRPVSDRLHGPGKEKEPDEGRPAPPGVRALRCFFQGYYLRSLLEARWLIFLRTLCPDSAVFYEPYTTVLPDTGQSYTPDFLVAMRVSAQVAHAASPTREAERAIAAGASDSALRGVVFHPDFRVFWLEIKPKPPNHPERWRMRRLVEETGIEGYVFYGQSMDEPTEDLRDRSARARYVDGLHAVHFPAEDPSATVEPMAFAECPACLRFGITMHGSHRDLGCGCEVSEDAVFSRYFSPLHTAYAVARSARVVEESRNP